MASIPQAVKLEATSFFQAGGSPPKAIHIRLSPDALHSILALKAKGNSSAGDRIILTEGSGQAISLQIGAASHALHSVKEEQPHDIYKTSSDGSTWQLQGRLTERVLLESDMSDRLRQRTEAANAEKADRHVILLQSDPHAKTAKATASNGLNRTSPPRPVSSASSPRLPSAPLPKPRHTPRLVADHVVVKPTVAVQAPQMATEFVPDHPTIIPNGDAMQSSSNEPSPLNSQEAAAMQSRDQDDSLDSASSSGGTTSTFNFSSGGSLSSRTSVSSGDSPPSKDSMHIHLPPYSAPQIAILTATPISESIDLSALGFNAVDSAKSSPSTVVDVEMEDVKVSKIRPTASPLPGASSSDPSRPKKQTDAAYYNSIAPPPPAAIASRSPSGSPANSSSENGSRSPRPSHRPHINGRTAGGARYSRPTKSLPSRSTSPEVGSGASTPVPASASALPSRFLSVTPVSSPVPGWSATKKRKSDLSDGDAQLKKKKKSDASRRSQAYYTSSEDENSEAPLSQSQPDAARGRNATAKPLRTSVAGLTTDRGEASRANTPSGQWTASPQAATAFMGISSRSDFEQQHARFGLLSKEFAGLCTTMKKHRGVLEAFVSGKDVSNDDRLAIPSKREAETLSQKAKDARTELIALKAGLWAFARSQAPATS